MKNKIIDTLLPLNTKRRNLAKNIYYKMFRKSSGNNKLDINVKLNLGCGKIYFDGWTNVDIDSEKADLKIDLTKPMPFKDNSVDIIYNEHFIEHLDVKEGVAFLKECFRILKKGGVLRIATPDLNYLCYKYFFFWKKQDWIQNLGYNWIKTKSEMINIGFREWGHKWLYNEEELQRRLTEAGFTKMKKVKWNKSKHPELKNRETRKDSKLIIEAIK